MKTKVFIDGREGTTGLRLYERLSTREDLTLLVAPEEGRKDPVIKKELMKQSDVVFLCLPDAAARESVALAEGLSCKIIDASTAHRTLPDWAYGFPELSAAHRKKIAEGKRVAVPGCHASGFISLVYPLVQKGILSSASALSCFSVTGYSGGGKKMMAEYESEQRDISLDSPRQYATGQTHKHLKEMSAITGLQLPPVFLPVVSDFACGMVVSVPLHQSQMQKVLTVAELTEFYREWYKGEPMIEVLSEPESFVASNTLAGKDGMQLTVAGNDDRIVLIARYDNLGKGASGAAVQCFNIMTGKDQTTGLVL